MVEWLDEVVSDFLAEDTQADWAYSAMRARGLTETAAREEIARAMLGCLWEATQGMSNRILEVLDQLARGRSCAELFHEALSATISNDGVQAH
jgi:hypothetical protein